MNAKYSVCMVFGLEDALLALLQALALPDVCATQGRSKLLFQTFPPGDAHHLVFLNQALILLCLKDACQLLRDEGGGTSAYVTAELFIPIVQ